MNDGVGSVAEEAVRAFVFGVDVEIFDREAHAVKGAAEGGVFRADGREALAVPPVGGIGKVDVLR